MEAEVACRSTSAEADLLRHWVWLQCLLASADQSGVGDGIGKNGILLHCLEHLQDLLSLNAFLAGADQGIVGNDIGQHGMLLHCPEHLHGCLALEALHANADQSAVGGQACCWS